MAELNESLSERELEVLEEVMQGAANKEIALSLSISPNTVKVHLRNIYTKLGVSSRTEASMMALERGLVRMPGSNADEEGQQEELGQEQEEENDGVAIEDVEQEVAELAMMATTTAEVGESEPPLAEGKQEQEITWAAPEAITPTESEVLATEPHKRDWRPWGLLGVALLLLPVVWWLGGADAGVGDDPVATVAVVVSEEILPTATAVFELERLNEPRWLRSRPLPAPAAHMALVASGNTLYHIGGEREGRVLDEVLLYETNTRAWRAVSPKPTAVADTTGAVLLEIYVPGGRTAEGKPTAVVEAYSRTSETWRTVSSLPQPVLGGLTLVAGSRLYYIGGWNGANYLDTLYAYDPSTDAWELLPAMPTARAFAMGGTVENKLYVLGGENETAETLAICEVYDPEQERWASCESMTTARAAGGAAVVLNKLYVLGGQVTGTERPYGEVFDPESGRWQIINTPVAGQESGVLAGEQYVGVASVEAQIYLVGGRIDTERVADTTLIYAPPIYQTYLPSALGEPADE